MLKKTLLLLSSIFALSLISCSNTDKTTNNSDILKTNVDTSTCITTSGGVFYKSFYEYDYNFYCNDSKIDSYFDGEELGVSQVYWKPKKYKYYVPKYIPVNNSNKNCNFKIELEEGYSIERVVCWNVTYDPDYKSENKSESITYASKIKKANSDSTKTTAEPGTLDEYEYVDHVARSTNYFFHDDQQIEVKNFSMNNNICSFNLDLTDSEYDGIYVTLLDNQDCSIYTTIKFN